MEKCPKCNSEEIKVKFRHEEEKVYWSEHKEVKNLSKFTRNDDYYAADSVETEFLQYRCENCGYKEAKKTKDNEQTT